MEDLTEENKNVHAILATSVDYKIVKKRIDTGFFWASENFDSEQQIAGEESDRVAEWQIALQGRLQKELLAAGCRGADYRRFEL